MVLLEIGIVFGSVIVFTALQLKLFKVLESHSDSIEKTFSIKYLHIDPWTSTATVPGGPCKKQDSV